MADSADSEPYDEDNHMGQDIYNGEQAQFMAANAGLDQQSNVADFESMPHGINSEPNLGATFRIPERELHGISDPPAYGTSNDLAYDGEIQPQAEGAFQNFLPPQGQQIQSGYDGGAEDMAHDHDHCGIDYHGDLQRPQHEQRYAEAAYPVEPAYGDMQPAHEYAHMEQHYHPQPEIAPAVPKKSKKSKKRKKKVQPQGEAEPPPAPPQMPVHDYQEDARPRSMQEQAYEDQTVQEMDHDQQMYDQDGHGQQQYNVQQYEQQQYSDMDHDQQRYDQKQYPANQGRLRTPQQDQYDQYDDASSPHTQLNEDLQAAAWSPNQEGVRDSVPSQIGDYNQLRPPVFQINPSLQLPRGKVNATATQMTSRPGSAVLPGQDFTTRLPILNVSARSQVEQPSSDIEESFQHFYRTFNKKSTRKETQFAAEKQSIEHELQQAINAKSALEDQIATLLQDKESLAASLQKGKATQADLKRTAQKLQTFANGIGNDLEKLKKDAETYRHQSTALVDEGKAQMSKHAEESKRLNEEVVKQCQAARSQLSAAATRTAHLEENLKQRSDALAEEKKLRLQLQSQINSVDYVKDAVLRQMKTDRDAVLDKLYEVHAMLEDTDNRQEVTEMLDKTATAIQGLNLQQATTVDDVDSVKSMMESLTESMSRTVTDHNPQDEEKLSALQSRVKELEVELQSKASEVTSLQDKLKSRPTAASISDKDEETIRKEAVAYQAQRNAELENEVKKLRARPGREEVSKLKQKLADTQHQANKHQEDMDGLNEKLEAERRSLSTTQRLADSRQRDLDKLHEQLANEKREFESRLAANPSKEELASTKEQLSEAHRTAEAHQQDINRINVQLENEKRAMSSAQRLAEGRKQELDTLHEQLSNQQRAFEKELGDRPTAEELSSTKAKLSEAQQLVSEKEENVSNLGTQLEKEKEKNQRLESEIESHKASNDAALDQELAQLRNELDIRKKQEVEFRTQLDESWREEQQKFSEERTSMQKQLQEAQEALRRQQAAISSAKQPVEPDRSRSGSPVVEESQQDTEIPSFAAIKQRNQHPIYADTQQAHGHLQDSIFRDEDDDKENAFTYKKPQAAPNSSSKRAMHPMPQNRSSNQSSSPGFMASQPRQNSTMYGIGSSGQKKRRLSQGKDPAKRKADGGQIVDGYEEERRKRLKPNANGSSVRSSTNPISTMTMLQTGAPPGSSQASYRETLSQPQRSYRGTPAPSQGSHRGRVTRSRTTEVMNARFAQEQPATNGGLLAGGLRTRQK